MPEVIFYILQTESSQEKSLFVCKLIEKAYRTGVFPYILTDSMEQAQALDDLLWTFRAGSFIPHQLFTDKLPAIEGVVLIGTDNAPENWQKAIINLSSQCPHAFQQAGRILEILDNSEETKAWGRRRYREYQKAGIEIATHNR